MQLPALKKRKKKAKFRSIQTKLTLAIILILIPVVALISILSFRNTQQILESRIFEQFESIAISKQDQINNFILQNLELTKKIASDPIIIENISTSSAVLLSKQSTLKQKLSDQLSIYPQIENIWLSDQEGNILVTGDINEEENISLKEKKYHSSGLKKFSFTIDETDIYLSGPIQENNQLIGVLILKILPKQLLSIVSEYSGLGTTGDILLGKRIKNEIILLNQSRHQGETEKFRIDVKQNPRTPIALATQKLSGTTITDDYRGINVYAIYRYITSADLGMVIKINNEEAFAPIASLRTELLKISILTVMLFMLVAFIVSRSITEPLHRLHIGTEKIAQGEWDYVLNVKSGDEVEQLASEFTKMAQELKGLYKGLEDKVKQRTAQLEEEKQVSEKLAGDLKKFQLAVENASDQIIITDPDANIIYSNKALQHNTGYSIEEVIGKKPGELWGGKMDDKLYEKMWKDIKTNKKTYEGEVTNKRKNGETYVAALGITPILDQEGNVQFFVGIERDITKAKEVDRMKTEFISIASHQLRTPLSAIKWFTEMLLSGDAGEPNSEQMEYLQQVYDSNERMIELVNSLLNVSRIEQGRIAIEPKPTDLITLVNQVISELKPRITQKKLKVIISAHDNLPKISIDPKLIRQVYANLLTNSVKYTPDGGEINIFISRKNKDIISQIKDSGYGIPKDQQNLIFSKFFRASNIRKVSPDGSGLGLYIVKSIIESSGGRIWFESEEEKGTTFWFTLPEKGIPARKGERTLEEIKI